MFSKTSKKTTVIVFVICLVILVTSLYGCNKDTGDDKMTTESKKTTSSDNSETSSSSNRTDEGEDTTSKNDGSSGTTRKDTTKKPNTTVKVTTTKKNAVYAAPIVYTNVASGVNTYTQGSAALDYSNSSDGYVMIKYSGSNSKVKSQVTGGGKTYTYDIPQRNQYVALPLTQGSTTYKITVLENVSGTSYATVLSQSISISLKNQFSPFLRPNIYVNYTASTSCVKASANACTGCSTQVEKISAVFNWVMNWLSYDTAKASSVSSTYVPDLNNIYNIRKGICYDYASMMTAMLRSQGIPTKLIFGDTGYGYHAWINTYISGTGWVNGAIYFDGKNWKLMDPTFVDTGGSNMYSYTNYVAKYQY